MTDAGPLPEDDSADHDPPGRRSGLLPLRCTTSRPRPDVCVVHLAGELDIATVPLVADYLRRQTATRPVELVLDLSEITHLGARGLALIVAAGNNDGGIHGRLHLLGVTGNRPVERALQVTGLLTALTIHDNLQALLDRLP